MALVVKLKNTKCRYWFLKSIMWAVNHFLCFQRQIWLIFTQTTQLRRMSIIPGSTRHTCHFQFILVIYNPFQFRIQVKCFGPLWQRSLQVIASLSLQKRFNCSLWRSKMVLALLRKSPEVRLVSFYQFSNHTNSRLSGNVVPCNSTRTRGLSNALIDKRKRWARGSSRR